MAARPGLARSCARTPFPVRRSLPWVRAGKRNLDETATAPGPGGWQNAM